MPLTIKQKNLYAIRAPAAELRDKIASGLEQIRRGETVDGKAAIQSLRAKLHERERGGQ